MPNNSTPAPKVFESLNQAIGAGIELQTTTPSSNPSGWDGGVVNVDVNPTSNTITLTAQDDLDFQTFVVKISNVVFDSAQAITGMSLVSNGLTTPTLNPIFGFTNNSMTISFSIATGEFDFLPGESAVFAFTLSEPAGTVPVPATAALLFLGLVGIAKVRRSRK